MRYILHITEELSKDPIGDWEDLWVSFLFEKKNMVSLFEWVLLLYTFAFFTVD